MFTIISTISYLFLFCSYHLAIFLFWCNGRVIVFQYLMSILYNKWALYSHTRDFLSMWFRHPAYFFNSSPIFCKKSTTSELHHSKYSIINLFHLLGIFHPVRLQRDTVSFVTQRYLHIHLKEYCQHNSLSSSISVITIN